MLSCCNDKKSDAFLLNRFPPFPISPYEDLLEDKVYHGYISNYTDTQKASILTDNAMNSFRSFRLALKYVELKYEPFDLIFVTKDGKRYQFAEGRFVPEGADYIKERNSILIYRYPDIVERNKEFRYKRGNPVFDFYGSVYGETNEDVIASLRPAKIFGRNRRFNTRNNAHYFLEKAAKEISLQAESDIEIMQWIKSIKHIYTYSERNIATRDVPSLHSFGIAIDFRFYNERKHIYWYWSSYLVDEWWNVSPDDRVQVPAKVVKIFENNGFAWGGKWPNYDSMHFEYRPEVVLRKFTYNYPKDK